MVDASALIAAVADRTPLGDTVRTRLLGCRRHAPHLIDAEVGNVLRRMADRGELPHDASAESRRLAEALVQRRHPHVGMIGEMAWRLRKNVTFYDGMYVALAQHLDAPLITLDGRLNRALPKEALIEHIAVP